MKTQQEITDLLTRHEADMASALKREEKYSHGRHEDREEAQAAAFDYQESKSAAQVLRWVLGLETDRNYSHLFPRV